MRNKPGQGSRYANGYVLVQHKGVRKAVHILMAEKALGHPLPEKAQVHHINCKPYDNRNDNLVICPGGKYHKLLHARTTALNAGYPPHFRKCNICKVFDDPDNLYIKPRGNTAQHRVCTAKRLRENRAARKRAACLAQTKAERPSVKREVA